MFRVATAISDEARAKNNDSMRETQHLPGTDLLDAEHQSLSRSALGARHGDLGEVPFLTGGQFALETARKSVVLLKNALLKNQNRLLPRTKTTKTIAVLGPNADDAKTQLGNYNGIRPRRSRSPKESAGRFPSARM